MHRFQIYAVGGAVRDELLGLPVKDYDWIVVGATPDDMHSQGFKPIGRDFPVFLHPDTNEEYALARTERKSAPGYHGFVFHSAADVTLEQDLARRDLTINAIARDENGEYLDPWNGRQDLENKILRHVSSAFVEDPVRVLRLARFAARFTEFSIAPETMGLMQSMVTNGEIDHLVAERTWQELACGLMESRPSRMIETLRQCNALAKILPEIDALFGIPQRADYHPEIDTGIHLLMALDTATHLDLPLHARFAVLCHDLGKATTPTDILPRHIGHEARGAKLVDPLCQRLRVPADCRDVAKLVTKEHGDIGKIGELRPATVVKLLERCDAIRRPQRFMDILGACEADFRGRISWENTPFLQKQAWVNALDAARSVDAGAIAREQKTPQQIAAAVHQARVDAVRAKESSSVNIQTQ